MRVEVIERGRWRKCNQCGEFQNKRTGFYHNRAQCKSCCRANVRAYQRGERKPKPAQDGRTQAYNSQSVLLMSEVIPCPRCWQPIVRRGLNLHLKTCGR